MNFLKSACKLEKPLEGILAEITRIAWSDDCRSWRTRQRLGLRRRSAAWGPALAGAQQNGGSDGPCHHGGGRIVVTSRAPGINRTRHDVKAWRQAFWLREKSKATICQSGRRSQDAVYVRFFPQRRNQARSQTGNAITRFTRAITIPWKSGDARACLTAAISAQGQRTTPTEEPWLVSPRRPIASPICPLFRGWIML